MSAPTSAPMVEATQSTTAVVMLWIFVVGPFVALIAAIPIARGWGLSPLDAVMAGIGYRGSPTTAGITPSPIVRAIRGASSPPA